MDYNYQNSGFGQMDNELYEQIRHYLHEDEQVLWSGRPCSASKPRISPYLAVFTVFWLGFAVFWTVMATAMGGAFGLFGIPFIFIGGTLFYKTFFGNAKMLKNTVYVATDRRALIISNERHGTTCNEYNYSKLKNVNLSEVKGLVGTIRFENGFYDDYSYADRGYYYRRRGVYSVDHQYKTVFYQIENVHEVYRIISERVSQEN